MPRLAYEKRQYSRSTDALEAGNRVEVYACVLQVATKKHVRRRLGTRRELPPWQSEAPHLCFGLRLPQIFNCLFCRLGPSKHGAKPTGNLREAQHSLRRHITVVGE